MGRPALPGHNMQSKTEVYTLKPGDALLVIDVQQDFLLHGSLAVPDGDAVIPVLNSCISLFQQAQLPVFATRDWHPSNHCSFVPQGGPWPVHCVAGSPGAALSPLLLLPANAVVVNKATEPQREAYSGFECTTLHQQLQALGVQRLFTGGLATEYCVLHSVQDALRHGYRTVLLHDAIRAVSATDGAKAIVAMQRLGAVSIESSQIRLPQA